MKDKYPKVSSIKESSNGGLCYICQRIHKQSDKRNIWIVTVQTSWFRGDDVIKRVCTKCGPDKDEAKKRLLYAMGWREV